MLTSVWLSRLESGIKLIRITRTNSRWNVSPESGEKRMEGGPDATYRETGQAATQLRAINSRPFRVSPDEK